MKIALNFIVNLLLLIVSLLLGVFLLPVGFIYGMIASFIQRKWYNGIVYMGNGFRSIAVSIDQLGNVVCAQLFNLALITKLSEHQFGNPDETISSVLGKNQRGETLAFLGKALNKLLHLLEKDHSIISIEDDEKL